MRIDALSVVNARLMGSLLSPKGNMAFNASGIMYRATLIRQERRRATRCTSCTVAFNRSRLSAVTLTNTKVSRMR